MTEEKKGTVFGGVALTFVAVILVLIIVFAVKGKSSSQTETSSEKDSVSVSLTQESSSQQEQISEQQTESESSEHESANRSVRADGNNSKQNMIDEENSRYEKEVSRINEYYDTKVAAQKSMKKLIEEKNTEKVVEYQSQLDDVNARIASEESHGNNSSRLNELYAERNSYIAEIESLKSPNNEFDDEIEKYENERLNELAEAKSEHEKNLAEING